MNSDEWSLGSGIWCQTFWNGYLHRDALITFALYHFMSQRYMEFASGSVEKVWASFQVLTPSRFPHYHTSRYCIQGRRDASADSSFPFDSWEAVTADSASQVTSAVFTDNDPFSSQVLCLFSYHYFFVLQAILIHRINVSFLRPENGSYQTISISNEADLSIIISVLERGEKIVQADLTTVHCFMIPARFLISIRIFCNHEVFLLLHRWSGHLENLLRFLACSKRFVRYAFNDLIGHDTSVRRTILFHVKPHTQNAVFTLIWT